MKKFKVQWLIDQTYQVLRLEYIDLYSPNLQFLESDTPEVVFQGSLADCESYIRLKEQVYL